MWLPPTISSKDSDDLMTEYLDIARLPRDDRVRPYLNLSFPPPSTVKFKVIFNLSFVSVHHASRSWSITISYLVFFCKYSQYLRYSK